MSQNVYFFEKIIFLDAFCHKGKFALLKYMRKYEFLIPLVALFNKKKISRLWFLQTLNLISPPPPHVYCLETVCNYCQL
jgi:hypothetical protein